MEIVFGAPPADGTVVVKQVLRKAMIADGGRQGAIIKNDLN